MRLACREARERRIQTIARMVAAANTGPAIIQMRKPETGYWTLEMGGSGLDAGS